MARKLLEDYTEFCRQAFSRIKVKNKNKVKEKSKEGKIRDLGESPRISTNLDKSPIIEKKAKDSIKKKGKRKVGFIRRFFKWIW